MAKRSPALLLAAWLLLAPLAASAQKPPTSASLRRLGMAAKRLNQYAQAMRWLTQAQTLAHESGDRRGEAQALAGRALVENDQDRKDDALADDRAARTLFRAARDRDGEAGVVSSQGDVQFSRSRFAEALGCYAQAEKLFGLAGDRAGQAGATGSRGLVALALGDDAGAMDALGRALPVLRRAGDRYGEAKALNNLSSVYFRLRHYDRAIRCCRQALPLFQRTNPDGAGKGLITLGNIFSETQRPADALRCYRQSLPIFRQVGDRYGEGIALNNLGDVYTDLRQYDKASAHYQRALIVKQSAGDQEGRGDVLDGLRQVCLAQRKPDLAIFYGKQAINVYQGIRRSLQALPRGTQASYRGIHEDTYRALADLLIRRGRLPEAGQVLGLLKAQETFEFLRGGPLAAGGGQADTDLTPGEAAQEQIYTRIAGQVIALGREQQELSDKAALAAQGGPALNDADRRRQDSLDLQLQAASSHLTVYFRRLDTAFAAPTAANKAVQMRRAVLSSADDLQSRLHDLEGQGQDVAVLETLVTPDRCAVIVTTAQTQKVEEVPIPEEALNQKVAALQAALRDPQADPRGPAHELYQILVKPLEADLAQAHATTLMWSLDGTLRYVPIAALYDGKAYLVQRFRSEVFTLGSRSGFGERAPRAWRGLGLGVSLPPPGSGFDPLPAVPEELRGIIRDPLNPDAGTGGVLPGEVLLNGQFTGQAMTDALRGPTYNLVHVASHFALRPGDPSGSFLLLGDGSHLSLSQFAVRKTLFQDVDLLSLSACETATGGAGRDGAEVDSLGTIAQKDGAKSVLASLWPVADASTRQLMQTFYRGHETQPGLTKAAALQAAQLSLLHGSAAPGGAATRGTSAVAIRGANAALPPFVADPNAPYAHPFYWAPFILIGNWR